MVRRGWEKTIAFAIRSVDPVLTKEGLGEVGFRRWLYPTSKNCGREILLSIMAEQLNENGGAIVSVFLKTIALAIRSVDPPYQAGGCSCRLG